MEKKDFRKLYEDLVMSDWFKKVYHDKSLGECPFEIPELEESEDEKIRKDIYTYIYNELHNIQQLTPRTNEIERWLSWLEKQKERGPLTKEEEYTLHRIIEYLEDEICPSEWVNLLHDIYCLPYQKQKEPHYTKQNALFDKCVENCDPEVMKRVSDEVDEMMEKERKEQKPVKCELEDAFKYYTDAGITISCEDIVAKPKEQKPEPVFKVGDKIKLKSELNYPYREIIDIKNGAYYFDEVVYLPFDNQDNWEKEQKPSHKFNVGDTIHCKYDDREFTIKSVDLANGVYKYTKEGCGNDIDYADENFELVEQKPAEWSDYKDKVNVPYCSSEPEWSEEETKDLVHIVKVLDDCYAYGKHDLSKTDHDNLTSMIKSLRSSWKPSEEQMEVLRRALHINPASGKLHYLKENEVCILQGLLKQLEKL